VVFIIVLIRFITFFWFWAVAHVSWTLRVYPFQTKIYWTLTHRTYFSLLVMLVILVNCVFMAINKEMPVLEWVWCIQ